MTSVRRVQFATTAGERGVQGKRRSGATAEEHENSRGFGEDCLSVQGSSGAVLRSIAEGREFRSRREFSGSEGTMLCRGQVALEKCGAASQDKQPDPNKAWRRLRRMP